MSDFNLGGFKKFLNDDLGLSPVYKTYDDSFLSRGAQTHYIAAKWAHEQQQAKIDEAIFDLQHIEDAMWAEQVEHVLMVLRGSPCDTP